MQSLSDTVIGAALALSGVLLAQVVAMLQSWLDRRNKRQVLLRTKYEEFGLLVLDSMKLAEELLRVDSHEKKLSVVHQKDANKALLLALIYFPLLRQVTGQYIESYAALAAVALSIYTPQNRQMLGAQVSDSSEYSRARDAHLAARKRLQDQIEIQSVVYAKS